VVAVLPRFQVEAGRDLNYKVCYPRRQLRSPVDSVGLELFSSINFLRLAGIPFNEQALEDDFSRLTKFLLSASRDYFLYRDFQSRNIMPAQNSERRPALFPRLSRRRKGALQYDIASLLYDAKADLPRICASNWLDHYLDSLAGFIALDRSAFMQYYYAYVYVRINAGPGRLRLSRLLRAQRTFLAKRCPTP